MTPERWARAAELYESALAVAPDARAAFLAQACRDDSGLRREVESLLAQEQAAVLVDAPIDVAAAVVLGDDATGLQPNDRIGPYVIEGLLGAGGMGQVYRARDVKLQRDVALKILPKSFLHDPDRLARFTREAHVLASLNHPNIGAIHGFEDSGPVHALVLELVEGPTLADRIARGPIPVDEALAIARQTTEALEAAHEHGIVHRDLKPANIKVREDGTVKVLDFGLAKPGMVGGSKDQHPPSTVSQSPTVLSPAVTSMGVILGTAAYMSPEQAKGKPADKRSDIWAFGCVLYEMLTGKRAFEGDDVADTLAAVLRGTPEWAAIPSSVPAPLITLIARCLEKDRRKRIGDISVPLFLLRDSNLLSPQPARQPFTPSSRRTHVAVAILGLTVAALGGAMIWLITRRQADSARAPVTRLEIPIGEGSEFTNSGRHLVAISPDGRRIAYAANNRLYLRELSSLDATPIRTTDGTGGGSAREPFFSPDGQWLGFWENGALKKVRVTGGTPEEIAKAGYPAGVNWDTNDVVYGQGADGIWRVPANGTAPPQRIIAVGKEQVAHGPQWLPGNRILFTLLDRGDVEWGDAQIVVQSLETGERRVLFRGATDARYVAPDHLLYVVNETLLVAPFDLATLRVGDPVASVPGVGESTNSQTGSAHYSVSRNGTLVHVKGSFNATPRSVFAWVDRRGHESVLPPEPGHYSVFRVSPDGERVAVVTRDRELSIWIFNLQRSNGQRLMTMRGRATRPVWMPNGRELLFGFLSGAANADVWSQVVDGTEPPRQLTDTPEPDLPTSVSGDGTRLFFDNPLTGGIGTFSLTGARRVQTVQTLLKDLSRARNGEISPNGRCLAYEANNEIYIQPFPEGGQRELATTAGGLTAGGTQPGWAADGSELFYVGRNGGLFRVPIERSSCKAGPAALLIDGPYLWEAGRGRAGRDYDIAPDGQRFLVLKPVAEQPGPPSSLVVVQNWLQEWKTATPWP